MHALVFCGHEEQEEHAAAARTTAATAAPVAFTAAQPRPAIAHPLDAIVRVSCAGVCGSDLHCAWHCLEKGLANGTVVGHEAVGTIVALGDQAGSMALSGGNSSTTTATTTTTTSPPLRLGDRVLIPFTASCASCAACLRGDTCRCESSQLFGWRNAGGDGGGGLHGCQAQFVRVPLAPSTLLRLPGSAPDELGVLLGDILSTAFFCARQGGISPATKTVAVVGCGPVGLLAVLAAKHESKQAARVVAIDGVAERRALALELGADAAVAPDLDEARRAIGGSGGGGGGLADVVLEVVGGDSGKRGGPLRLAFDLLRPAGVLASQGVHTGTEWPWTPVEAYDKNLTFKAGRCPARRMAGQLIDELIGGEERRAASAAAAADALVQKALRIITHRGMPLSQGVEAYAMFAARRDGCVKVTLDPWARAEAEAGRRP
jgi:threonine dehydrogenase-like Zn-dependent dehydrogenase